MKVGDLVRYIPTYGRPEATGNIGIIVNIDENCMYGYYVVRWCDVALRSDYRMLYMNRVELEAV